MVTLTQSAGHVLRSDEVSSSLDDHTQAKTYAQSIRPAVTRPLLRRAGSRPLLRTTFKEFSAVVPIVVGDGEAEDRPRTRYLVHKELCTAASPFFAAALEGGFTETAEQSVRLPAERPEIFEWFLQWLYTGSLTRPLSSATSGCGSTQDAHTDHDLCNRAGSPKYFLLLDLWALADRLLADALCDLVLATVARLAATTNSVPTPADTWLLYDELPENARLRGHIVDLFACKKTERLIQTHGDEWHPRFLCDLVIQLQRRGRDGRTGEGCWALHPPLDVSQKCGVCGMVFCAACLKRHRGARGCGSPHDSHGCRAWASTSMCRSDHGHGHKEDRG